MNHAVHTHCRLFSLHDSTLLRASCTSFVKHTCVNVPSNLRVTRHEIDGFVKIPTLLSNQSRSAFHQSLVLGVKPERVLKCCFFWIFLLNANWNNKNITWTCEVPVYNTPAIHGSHQSSTVRWFQISRLIMGLRENSTRQTETEPRKDWTPSSTNINFPARFLHHRPLSLFWCSIFDIQLLKLKPVSLTSFPCSFAPHILSLRVSRPKFSPRAPLCLSQYVGGCGLQKKRRWSSHQFLWASLHRLNRHNRLFLIVLSTPQLCSPHCRHHCMVHESFSNRKQDTHGLRGASPFLKWFCLLFLREHDFFSNCERSACRVSLDNKYLERTTVLCLADACSFAAKCLCGFKITTHRNIEFGKLDASQICDDCSRNLVFWGIVKWVRMWRAGPVRAVRLLSLCITSLWFTLQHRCRVAARQSSVETTQNDHISSSRLVAYRAQNQLETGGRKSAQMLVKIFIKGSSPMDLPPSSRGVHGWWISYELQLGRSSDSDNIFFIQIHKFEARWCHFAEEAVSDHNEVLPQRIPFASVCFSFHAEFWQRGQIDNAPPRKCDQHKTARDQRKRFFRVGQRLLHWLRKHGGLLGCDVWICEQVSKVYSVTKLRCY